MNRISVFVIAQNEEEFIGRCLQSLRGLADEVIVVDGGSTDRTRQIAEEQGARVVENAWPGFAAQKSFALVQCRYEWVLTLDADEELSPELHAEIAACRPQLDVLWESDRIGGWAMPRRVFYEGRWILHGDWNPDYVTRLFRREGAHVGGGLVHERIEYEGRTRKLAAPLWHYTYRDRADHLARIRKYAALWAQSQHGQGRRTGALAPYGRSAWRFVRGLLLKQGILDGRLGWRIAAFSAYEVFLKYRALYQLSKWG